MEMRRGITLCCSVVLLMTGSLVLPSSSADVLAAERSAPSLSLSPSSVFLRNDGQLENPQVLFYGHAGEIQVGFGRGTLLLFWPRSSAPVDVSQREWNLVRVTFVGAESAMPTGLGPLPHLTNFLFGQDPAGWRTGVPSFREVVYKDLYAGIDLYYRTTADGVKYEFQLAAGVSPDVIAFRYEGIQNLRVEDGAAVVSTPIGEIRDTTLVAFQGASNVRCDFRVEGLLLGFSCPGVDPTRPLTIDPLMYASFLGNVGEDQSWSVAVDPSGSAYVTGNTTSVSFPTTPGVYSISPYGQRDIFVTKFTPDGSSLAYSTYLGGTGDDYAWSIRVNGGGAAIISGVSDSPLFPTTGGAYDTSPNGIGDAFVLELDAGGSGLQFSTMIGGSNWEEAWDVAVGPTGSLYVTGYTASSDFPTCPGAFDGTHAGGREVYIAILSPDASQLLYCTFLGESGSDIARSIAVDASGDIYVTGATSSALFPTTVGAFDRIYAGGEDGFVSKLNATVGSLIYSTFLGGAGLENLVALELDGSGTALVGGYTASVGFPTTPGAYDRIFNGPTDGVVVGLNASGSGLAFSTFLGGAGDEYLRAMGVDLSGSIYVAGATSSPDFPTTPGAYDASANGGFDAFLVKLDSVGSAVQYGSFLGGASTDWAWGLALRTIGDVFVSGHTTSSAFPANATSFDSSYNGGLDAFVARFNIATTPPNTTLSANAGADVFTPEGQALLLAGTATPKRTWVNLWTDDFESYPLGVPTAPWVDQSAGGSNYVEISNTVARGGSGQSMRLVDTVTSAGSWASRPVSGTRLELTTWAYALQTTGMFTPMMSTGVPPPQWEAVRSGMGPTGQFNYGVCSSIGTPSGVTYGSGVWYEIRFLADTATDSYDMYVDGALIAAGVPMCALSTGFTYVDMASAGSYIGEFFVDDVTLREEQDVPITSYSWDLDAAVDADLDGNFTNDSDLSGASASASFGDNGAYVVTLTVTDSLGATANDTLVVTVDSVAPLPTITLPSPVSLTTGAVLTVDATDPGSDDLDIAWTWNDGPVGSGMFLNGATPDPPHSPGGTFPFAASTGESRGFPAAGIYSVDVAVTDDDGGIAFSTASVDVRDWPVTSLSIGPPTYSGGFVYINDTSLLTLSAVDRSGFGVNGTFYRIDLGPTQAYSGPFSLAAPGPHDLAYWSTDALGGIEPPVPASVYVDVTPPNTTIDVTGHRLLLGGVDWVAPSSLLSLQPTDLESGVNGTWYRLFDGAAWSNWTPWSSAFSPPVLDGPFLVEFWSADNLGQEEAPNNASFTVDGTPPVTAIVLSGPSYVEGSLVWVTPSMQFSLPSNDTGVGVASVWYRLFDGAAWSGWALSPPGFQPPVQTGAFQAEWYALDEFDNAEVASNASYLVDGLPPITSLATAGPSVNRSGTVWLAPQTTLALSSVDAGSGVDEIRYRLFDGSSWTSWAVYSSALPPPVAGGAFSIEFYSVDNLGQAETWQNRSFTVDGAPPVTAPIFGVPKVGEWVTSNTSIDFMAADAGVGLDTLLYRVHHGGTWSSWLPGGPFTLAQGEGAYVLEFAATDLLGNAEVPQNVSLTLDDTPPMISYEVDQSDVSFSYQVTIVAQDVGSGLATLEYSLDGGAWTAYTEPFGLSGRSVRSLSIRATDRLGNGATAPTASLSPSYVNYKPLLAFLLVAVLLVVGLVLAWRRRRWRRPVLLVTAIFAGTEAVIGILSAMFDILLFPPLVGPGFLINLGITLGGLFALIVLARQRDPMPPTAGETPVAAPPPPPSMDGTQGGAG